MNLMAAEILQKENPLISLELRHLLSLPYHVFLKDKEFFYLEYNNFGSLQFGLDITTAIAGMNDFDIFSNETAAIIRDSDRLAFKNGELTFFSEEVTTKNNASFLFYGQKIPLFDHNHQIFGLLGLAAAKNNESGRKNHHCDDSNFIRSHQEILSPREHDCIQYLSCGLSVKQVAQKLKVSPRTVETYIERSKIKFNCHTKSELILAFLGKSLYSIFLLNFIAFYLNDLIEIL